MKSLIIIGPSGVGKGTIIKSLLAKYPIIKFVLSFTTRLPRNYEINGVDYEFVSEEQFDQIKNAGEMLENKTVFQKSYGTSLKSYSKLLEGGYIPIMDVDVEGMLDIRSKLIQLGHHPEVLCILPPSLAIL